MPDAGASRKRQIRRRRIREPFWDSRRYRSLQQPLPDEIEGSCARCAGSSRTVRRSTPENTLSRRPQAVERACGDQNPHPPAMSSPFETPTGCARQAAKARVPIADLVARAG